MTAHLLDSLHSAARLAVKGDCVPTTAESRAHWCITFKCSVDQLDEAIRLAKNGTNKLPEELAASAPPAPSREEEPE